MTRKFVVAGGSGFIGHALTTFWSDKGDEVVVLSRSSKPVGAARSVRWDGETVGEWAAELEGATAVVNLSGAPISKRHTPAYRKELIASRVGPTETIGKAIAQCKTPPTAWVNASAIGYYGDRGTELLGESSASGTDFMAEVARKWEAACTGSEAPATRKILPRIGIVLGRGGALDEFKKIPHRGIGSGKQVISWIHVHDLVRLIDWTVSTGV